MGELGDEGPVEITEAEEASDVFYSEWRRPLGDTLYFCRVHLHFSLSDDDSEVLDLFLVKLAFLRF